MTPTYQRYHAFVHGVVQGVGFRFFVLRTAHDLKLTGWVRNRYDGSVEVTAEGTRESLDALNNALQRGPNGARVSDVISERSPASGEFPNFTVCMDA